MAVNRRGDWLIGDSRKSIDQAYEDMFKGNNMGKIDPKVLQHMQDLLNSESFTRRETSVFTAEEMYQATKEIDRRIEQLKKEREGYQRAIEFVNSLPFKDGDAAFHRTHGNVLVTGIMLNENFENSSYSILLKTGKRLQVPLSEIVPITEATKILYAKG